MKASLRAVLARALRRWSLPLGCYYVVTLAIPAANGAWRRGAVFASHALVVLMFPLLLIVLMSAVAALAQKCRGAPL